MAWHGWLGWRWAGVKRTYFKPSSGYNTGGLSHIDEQQTRKITIRHLSILPGNILTLMGLRAIFDLVIPPIALPPTPPHIPLHCSPLSVDNSFHKPPQ